MGSRTHSDYDRSRRYSRSRSRSPRRGRYEERDERYESDRYGRDRRDRYHERDRRGDGRDDRGRDQYYSSGYNANGGNYSYSSRERGRGRYDDHYERRGSKYDERGSSPFSERKRHLGQRENPTEGRRLAIFGLNTETKEGDLFEFFGQWGEVEECQLVYDRQSGRSRGFGFINFKNKADAVQARGEAHERELDGKRIRVDFSITDRAHTPTPGVYLGRPNVAARPDYGAPPPPSAGGRPYYS